MNEGTLVNSAALIGGVVALAAIIGVWRWRKWRVVAVLLAIPALLFGIVSVIAVWYGHRPLPEPTHATLFRGIDYIRDVRSTPRPLVLHIVRIDLTAAGLEFVVTPGVPDETMPARTVSQFLTEFDVQLAINGGYFDPSWDNSFLDYYPREGDLVRPVFGTFAARGVVYAADPQIPNAVFISADSQVSFRAPIGEIYNAVGGNTMLLYGGVNVIDVLDLDKDTLNPRTAVGLDNSGQMPIFVIVDGRQPGYSEGVNLSEMAELMREYGAYHALNLDGGGSSTLVVEGADGQPLILNSPIHSRIPGRERPVATHLGLIASGSTGD